MVRESPIRRMEHTRNMPKTEVPPRAHENSSDD